MFFDSNKPNASLKLIVFSFSYPVTVSIKKPGASHIQKLYIPGSMHHMTKEGMATIGGAAAGGWIGSNNWQNADYECGLNCKYKDGMNICKKTEK